MATENRLIDANALKTAIQGTVSQVAMDAPYDPEWFTRLAARQFEILKIIDHQPTMDAVEVVRCKDCKHFVQGEPYDPCECMKWMVKFGVAYTTPDGYCHKGERKDKD